MDVNQLQRPETLPDVKLIEILESLCIPIPPNTPRFRILEIFRKVAVPLPQRTWNISKSKINNGENLLNFNNLSISNCYKREITSNIANIVNHTKKIKLNDSLQKLIEVDCKKCAPDNTLIYNRENNPALYSYPKEQNFRTNFLETGSELSSKGENPKRKFSLEIPFKNNKRMKMMEERQIQKVIPEEFGTYY